MLKNLLWLIIKSKKINMFFISQYGATEQQNENDQGVVVLVPVMGTPLRPPLCTLNPNTPLTNVRYIPTQLRMFTRCYYTSWYT